MEETPNKLVEALAKAQPAMRDAIKATKGHHGMYADLSAVRDATLPALNANGLIITQTTHLEEGVFLLRTMLVHTSGEAIESEYPLPRQPDKPQIMGSALTYARRYSWGAICGIASELDDDGETAQAKGSGRKTGKSEGRDIAHGVGTGEPEPPTFDVFNEFGETIDTAGNPKDFLEKITDLVDTSGAYWPNNRDNVKWIGEYYKVKDKALETHSRQVFKLGMDAHRNYVEAADKAKQGP